MSKTLNLNEATALVESIFVKHGVLQKDAKAVADALVNAQANGQNGHGFSRIQSYLAQVKTGKVNATPNLTHSKSKPTFIQINADGGFAYSALLLATDLLAETASEYGMAAASLYNSHHCGSLGQTLERLSSNGFIGIMVSNGAKAMAPWGGDKPIFGTNPIAFSVPRSPQPLTIDMSLSKVARGNLLAARNNDKAIPQGWALDSKGNPTTDPNEGINGTMIPAGDAKGASLALMVEILSSALTGSNFSYECDSMFEGEGPRPHLGQFIIAIDASAGANNFSERLEELLLEITNQEGARLPGQRAKTAYKKAQEHGIEISDELFDQLQSYL
ncbi:MAG: Ldh family oxidoreductase [Nitratireductor sp.]